MHLFFQIQKLELLIFLWMVRICGQFGCYSFMFPFVIPLKLFILCIVLLSLLTPYAYTSIESIDYILDNCLNLEQSF